MKEPNLNKKNKYKNKQRNILLILMFFWLIMLLGSSYALLQNFSKTEEVVTFKTGNLNMSINNALITLNGKMPESDEIGLQKAEPIVLTLTNTGTMKIEGYDVKLVNDPSKVSTLNEIYLKYSISLDDGITYSTPDNLKLDNNIIYTGYNLGVNESKTIYLKVWLDESSGNNALNKEYYGSIIVDLYQKKDMPESQEGIYITSVNYKSNVDADLNNSKTIFEGTTLNSNITLLDNKNSSITYQITIYNDTNKIYYFDKVSYILGNETYSNEDIIFELNGLKKDDVLNSKSSINFSITFLYKDNTRTNNKLISKLEFLFNKYLCPTDGRVCDLSGNNNHGVLSGATINSKESILYTDGVDDYVNCGLANYDFKNEISYILRFKINGWNDKEYWEFFGNWQNAGGGIRINEDKTFGASININNQYVVPKSSVSAKLDNWYTMIVTYDGSKIVIYVNGEEVKTTETSGMVTISTVPFYIGANPDPNGKYSCQTNLTVDYALLFDRTLTEEEVANDYLEDVTITNDEKLLMYYEFD